MAAGPHDIELHPRYAQTGWIYVSYSEGEEHRSTAAADRVRLAGRKVTAREPSTFRSRTGHVRAAPPHVNCRVGLL